MVKKLKDLGCRVPLTKKYWRKVIEKDSLPERIAVGRAAKTSENQERTFGLVKRLDISQVSFKSCLMKRYNDLLLAATSSLQQLCINLCQIKQKSLSEDQARLEHKRNLRFELACPLSHIKKNCINLEQQHLWIPSRLTNTQKEKMLNYSNRESKREWLVGWSTIYLTGMTTLASLENVCDR